MPMTHDVGIVIVNYNVRYFLEQCLQSIRSSVTQNLKLDVWVVDNASIDGSQVLVSSDYPEVHLISNVDNVGFSAANNQALKQIQAKYILLLNPDTVLEEDTLQKCYDFMESHTDAGAVGVRMIDGSGKFLPESKRKIPDLWNSFCKLTYLSDIFPKSKWFSGYNLGYLPEFQSNEVDVLCGAFMFMRSETLAKTGFLDEAFFMYGEDIDLSFRILKSGYKVWYLPETTIIHYKGESTKKSSLSYVKTFYGAMHIYVNKHYGKGNAAIFAKVIGLAISIRAFFSGAVRIIKQWVRPMIDFILVLACLWMIKDGWAKYHFHDAAYYQNTNILTVLTSYAIVWIFFLWLGGHYDKDHKPWNAVASVATGTVVILIFYALLPEYLRSSRAIILFGTIECVIVTYFTSLLNNWWHGDSDTITTKRVAIVAYKESAQKLVAILKNTGINLEQIYFIYPGVHTEDAWYSNTLASLPLVTKTLKINEIIFSSDDMKTKDIIQAMTQMESQVSFRIGGDESLHIIGSHNKNQQGELLSLDENYRLASTSVVRQKRLMDILASICMLPILPVLWLIVGMKSRIFSNWIDVLFGKSSWVGYGGEIHDHSFLPTLRNGIIKYPTIGKVLSYRLDYFKSKNTEYARDYQVMMDIRIIFCNLYRLGDQ